MADEDPDFTLMKKKKKKKKALVDDEPEPAQSSEAPAPTPAVAEEAADVPVPVSEPDANFSLKKKKKKKKPVDLDGLADDLGEKATLRTEADGDEPAAAGLDGEIEMNAEESELTIDRDYTYQQLLERVFNIMRQKNPDMVAGEKRKFVLKPPQVVRVGAKKTSFVNFTEICKLLHRQPKHLLAFICAELGTSASVDANNQLIIKGRYQQKQIESVLRRYIKEYVTCHTCRSPLTMMQKETRLFFLQCESCGSRCSVASIKSGFQAVTSKRAAQRAKQH